MGQLPVDWRTTQLSEIIENPISGRRPVGGVQGIETGRLSLGAEHLNSEGRFKLDSPRYIPEEFANLISRATVRYGDLLVVKDGATTGKTSFVGNEFHQPTYVNEHLLVVRTRPPVLPKYVFYFLWSSEGQREILKDFRGAAQGGISKNFASKVEIPVCGLNEQRRIVAKIEELFSELDKALESLNSARLQLQAYREAVFRCAFEDAAKDGQWVPLADLFLTDPQNGLYKPASSYGIGTQIVRINDFYNGRITRKADFKRLHLTDEEIEKFALKEGDLIINRVNSIEYLGKCALVPTQSERAVFESNIMRCRLIEGALSKEYVNYYLSSRNGRLRLCQNAKHAVNQASINQKDVGRTLVPLPSFQRQIEIVNFLDRETSRASQLLIDIDAQIEKEETLRQAVLHKAFSGQLLPQDPNDEPASVLLDRIKSEATSLPTKSKSRRKPTKAASESATAPA